MSPANQTRIKSEAVQFMPGAREEVDAAIAQIGTLQRERAAIQNKLNARVARLKEAAEHDAQPIGESIKMLSKGVQAWCEAHRGELLKGSAKTCRFGAGEISWRLRPPKVFVRGEALVIALLKKLGLDRFVRTKEEIDRAAILKEPDAVATVKGIGISQGEDFCIKPFALDLEEVL